MKTAYTGFGRIVHGYPHEAAPAPRVMDDFGNSVKTDHSMVAFHVRGPSPAAQAGFDFPYPLPVGG